VEIANRVKAMKAQMDEVEARSIRSEEGEIAANVRYGSMLLIKSAAGGTKLPLGGS